MTPTETVTKPVASVEEIQQGWHELVLRVSQLEGERMLMEQEIKALRFLLERVIEHRQKSHGELVMLLTSLVSKLPMNDVGFIVSKLVEHNAQVTEICAALTKGKAGAELPKPTILKALDQTKRDLVAALKPVVEELIQSDTPLETAMLKSLIAEPELFFSPAVVRANRCYVKGQLPRERIVREFGEQALIFFNDLTTDPKLNPRPKPEEIVLVFKPDFEAWFQQNPKLLPDKREELLALYQKTQRSKAANEQCRAQKSAFQRLSFILDLMHYYDNQNTEAPDVIFAQRLPVLIEQLVITGPQDNLDEKLIKQAEGLLAFVIKPDHRQMIVNNIGKGGGIARTLKFVLTLRAEKVVEENEVVTDFVKHLIPAKTVPKPETIAAAMRFIHPNMLLPVIRAIIASDRIRKEEADTLGRTVAKQLGMKAIEEALKAEVNVSPETERQMAWERVKELIMSKAEPAAIATAIRNRLHAKYDSDEVKQSWLTLIETDAMSLIRTFCQLPYLPDGQTDPIARAVMETYVTRLTHEKYAAAYAKVVGQLKNLFRVKPDSPTLLNFIALVKWVDPEAAGKLSADIGMMVVAH